MGWSKLDSVLVMYLVSFLGLLSVGYHFKFLISYCLSRPLSEVAVQLKNKIKSTPQQPLISVRSSGENRSE